MSDKDKVDGWMPLHIGRYMAATGHLSTEEHGMYLLLLMHAWGNKGAIPGESERVRRICRADPKTWTRSGPVILDFLTLQADGTYRQKRLDLELAKAIDLRGVKSEAGKKGAASKWQRHGKGDGKTDSKDMAEPLADGMAKRCPIPSPTPEPTPKPEQRNASDVDSAGARGAAALAGLKALSLGEAKIPGGDETPAAHLASVLKANGLRGNAFHPLVVEWARERITVERLKDAIAKARQRPGKEKGVFGPEYLDTILHDETKPAAQVYAEKASESAAKNVEKAQRILAEQRAREVAQMPEHLRPKAAP